MWAPQDFRKQNERPLDRQWVRVKMGVASLYDSWGKVDAPGRMATAIANTDAVPFQKIDVGPAEITMEVDPANGSEVVADPWGDIPEPVPLGRGWRDPHGLDRG
jgi:hypothetical protein